MRLTRLYLILIAVLLITTATAEAQVPQINSISADTLTRSGRLRIFGAGFGNGGGTSEVLIDGHSAIVTRWNDTWINAYVPEQSGPGVVELQVVTSGGASNTSQFTVTIRQPNGRVQWAFEADVENLWWRPALAVDGTIYVHGSDGFVFALSPDGGLKWASMVNWYAYVPPAVGSDGTIYVGSIGRITALNSDGTERWQFSDAGTQGVHSGPAIGPDGNIYFANDFGLGAYSLSPNGQLLWSNPGSPPISWYGGIGGETVLGPRMVGGAIEQMYVVPEPFVEDYTLQAFSLADGSLRFSLPIGGQDDPFGQQQTQPAVGPDGTIYVTHMRALGGIGWVLEAYSPVDGHSLWYYHGNNISGMTPPDVGPDGIVYYSENTSRIIAFNPNTLLPNWEYQDGTVMYHPTASPLNDIVVTGGVVTFGDVGFINAIGTASGQLLWSVPLPGAFYPEPRVVPVHHPRFTPNGNTVYVSTTILGGSPADPHAFLYAIATGSDSTTGGNIPCEAISFFNAKCNANGAAQAMVRLFNSTEYAGDTVEFQLDDTIYPVELITNGTHTIGRLQVPLAGYGQHTISLINPAGCYDPVTFSCQVDAAIADPEFEAAWAEFDAFEKLVAAPTPGMVRLVGNHPNPFNPVTTISYELPLNTYVTLTISDIVGRKVTTLVDGAQEAGYKSVIFDGSNLASGIYFYRLQAGDFVETKKLMLIR